jgi:hypothetical protein
VKQYAKEEKAAAATPYIPKSDSKLRHAWDVLSGKRTREAAGRVASESTKAPKVNASHSAVRAMQSASRDAHMAPFHALHGSEAGSTSKARMAAGGAAALGLVGAGLTARHISKKRKAAAAAKEASIPLSTYSELFDQVVAGEFGKEASAHLRGICLGIDAQMDARVVFEKTAGYSTGAPEEESDEDSRKRRLAELLRKREHSGTATGSASPNPPKGA